MVMSLVTCTVYLFHQENILSRAKGAGSPLNRQSTGQRRDTDRKSLADMIKVNDQVPETELY